LRAYLRNPLWEIDKTVSVVYVGLPAHRETDVRNLLAPLNIPLFAIAPISDVSGDEANVPPVPAASRRSGNEASETATPEVDFSDALEVAVVRARKQAAAAHAVLQPLTIGFGESFLIPITESETVQ
jgi:hypothetical protein